MSPRRCRAAALALALTLGIGIGVGCGGTVAEVGDGRADATSEADCTGFVPGGDLCGVVGARDARAAEAAQSVSELWRLAREAALSARWACDALAHGSPPAPFGPETPAPEVEAVEASCAAARARLESLAGKVRVTVRSTKGHCLPTLCPTQGMPGCYASAGFAQVERLSADVDEATLTIVRIAFEVLARVGATPAVEIASRIATLTLSAGDIRASCVGPYQATAQAATALLSAALAGEARVHSALPP